MIKVKELRVGNYALMPSSNNLTIITPIDLYDIGLNLKNRLPIPLNEEWLLKFGFKSYSHFTIMNSKFIDIGRNRQITIGCVGTPNEMIFLQQSDEKQKEVEDLICLKNFDYDGDTYIHQLQNLYFALTGEELTIKS